MGLIDLKTDLKSLRFGKDRVGGGNSNQPYVVTPIPEGFAGVGRTGGPDFLLRGGTLLPKVVIQDVSRLTKMFFDFRSPSGPLFIAKQNALSLTNVNSSSGYAPFIPATADTSGNLFQRVISQSVISQIGTFVQNNISLNQGIYTPLGTIAQSGVNAFGTHLLKQGFNPVDNVNPNLRQSFGFSTNRNVPLAMPTYLRTIYTDGDSDSGPKTRMQSLFNLQLNDPNNKNLLTSMFFLISFTL